MSVTLKKILVFTIAAVLVLGTMLLVACSDDSNSNGSAETSNSAASQNKNSENTSDKNTNKNSNSTSNSSKKAKGVDYVKRVSDDDPYASGIHHATVTVEGYEPFIIELDADKAPISVSNFCTLANDGFYDGLTFYRFQKDFCMQGGSSNNQMAAASDGLTPIKGEFSSNGVNNKLADKFRKGTVAMARSSDPNSATSTFFVTLSANDNVKGSLNGQYAAFGKIDEDGMAVVDQIVADHLDAAAEDSSGMGAIDDEERQAKIESIRITD